MRGEEDESRLKQTHKRLEEKVLYGFCFWKTSARKHAGETERRPTSLSTASKVMGGKSTIEDPAVPGEKVLLLPHQPAHLGKKKKRLDSCVGRKPAVEG